MFYFASKLNNMKQSTFSESEWNLIKKYFKQTIIENRTGSHRTYVYKVLMGKCCTETVKAQKIIRECEDLLAEAQYMENGL